MDVAAIYRRRLDAADPEGAAIWADLTRVCHANETTFVAGDPYLTAFREGARSVFLYLAGHVFDVPPMPKAED